MLSYNSPVEPVTLNLDAGVITFDSKDNSVLFMSADGKISTHERDFSKFFV